MNTNENAIDTNDIKKLLKPQDVATILNVSRSFAYLLLQSGQLPIVRLGKSVRVRVEDIEAFIKANRFPVIENGK